MTFTNEGGEQEKDDLVYNRQDFWATMSNKQLNFLQHIRSLLKTTSRWRKYIHAELAARDKTSLDLFWLKDDSLADLDNLPEPDVLAEEIIANIEAGLVNFRSVAETLRK